MQAHSYPHSGTEGLVNLALACSFVLASRAEIKEISTKSSQKAYKLFRLVNFWKLMMKTGKKYRITSKRCFFCQNRLAVAICHIIDITKFLRRMNEQVLKVLAP